MPYSNKAPKKAPAKTKLYSNKPTKKKAAGKPDTKAMKAKLKKG